MKRARHIILFFTFFFLSLSQLLAQENIATVGFQYKPIFSTGLIKTNPPAQEINHVNFEFLQNSGHCFGMMVRKGFKKNISFETGINYTRRNYQLNMSASHVERKTTFSLISYEVPVSLLVYIKLGKVYMNTSLGVVMDYFPSDVSTHDDYFLHFSYREHLFQPGLLANIGYEFRTQKSGYFYIGTSFHRPFKDIYQSHVAYYSNPSAIYKIADADLYTKLSGIYLTLDLRYFFHEDPQKKKDRKEKRKATKLIPTI